MMTNNPNQLFELGRREAQGFDSHVGEIVGDSVRLQFDLGWFSDPLDRYGAPDHVVAYEKIGGKEAKLVRSDASVDGLAGVHIGELYLGGKWKPLATKLTIIGEGLARDQQKLAYAIFRTVRRLQPTVLSGGEIQTARADNGALRVHAALSIEGVK